MSKVYLRSATNFWLPISAEAGAVPNQVLALDAAMQFKSICGLDDPPAERRLIRNAANTAWIELDQIPVNVPEVVGTPITVNGFTSQVAIQVPVGAQAGDLILGFVNNNRSTAGNYSDGPVATLVASGATTNINMGLYAVIHDGVSSSYAISYSINWYTTLHSVAVRNSAGYSGDASGFVARGASTFRVSQGRNVPENSLTLAWFEDNNTRVGAPYSDYDANWSLIHQYDAPSNYSDGCIAARSSPVAELTPDVFINASGSSTSMSTKVSIY